MFAITPPKSLEVIRRQPRPPAGRPSVAQEPLARLQGGGVTAMDPVLVVFVLVLFIVFVLVLNFDRRSR